jgi:hypothetical protein
MDPFKCEITLHVGDDSYRFDTYFQDEYAVELDANNESRVAAIYNLTDGSWRDANTGQEITLQTCEQWARASSEMSRKSLAQATDTNLKRFVELSLEPKFEVIEGNGEITLQNDVLMYRVSNPVPLSELQRQRFFAYDRLNAYRKAMTERKLPPFPQLAVDDEIERLEFVPGQIDVEIVTPSGDIEMTIELRIADLSDAEASRARDAIRASSK